MIPETRCCDRKYLNQIANLNLVLLVLDSGRRSVHFQPSSEEVSGKLTSFSLLTLLLSVRILLTS
jgi:hypothetical protein